MLHRLDRRRLSGLPAAFRMYAAGRLGKRAAWLVTTVATRRTERQWTRFALTHTLRLLQAAVEASLLMMETDHVRWKHTGGLPPSGASFAEVLRTCSLQKVDANPAAQATARIR